MTWPRPGRIFTVSPAHTFHAFGVAIDDAFARWDRSHLHEFTLPRLGKRVTEHRYIDDIDPDHELDADTVTLGKVLAPGQEFQYTFDLTTGATTVSSPTTTSTSSRSWASRPTGRCRTGDGA